MLRETEVANLRASCVDVRESDSPTATITLPASKGDQEGMGVKRTHTCICRKGTFRPFCPAHAAWDQQLRLRRLYPARYLNNCPDLNLPFLPTDSGEAFSK